MVDAASDTNCYARFVFSDDVRQELGGKHSLIGVYGHMMGIATNPTLLPRLVATCSLSLPLHYAGQQVTLQLHDGDALVLESVIELGTPSGAPQAGGDARFTQRVNVNVPVELIGFEVRDGMRLTMSAQLSDRRFESEPLYVAQAQAPDKH